MRGTQSASRRDGLSGSWNGARWPGANGAGFLGEDARNAAGIENIFQCPVPVHSHIDSWVQLGDSEALFRIRYESHDLDCDSLLSLGTWPNKWGTRQTGTVWQSICKLPDGSPTT
jgi:hypothetical protein